MLLIVPTVKSITLQSCVMYELLLTKVDPLKLNCLPNTIKILVWFLLFIYVEFISNSFPVPIKISVPSRAALFSRTVLLTK